MLDVGVLRVNTVCKQCIFIKENGQRCKRRTCVRKDYCWQHLRSQEGVDVRPSTFGGGMVSLRSKPFVQGIRSPTTLAQWCLLEKPNAKQTNGLTQVVAKMRSVDMRILAEVQTRNDVRVTTSKYRETSGTRRLHCA
jgi:hypothetical protein